MESPSRLSAPASAAGVPPDIAGLWDAQLVQFAAMDALEPLDALATAHGITGDYYKPIYWDACQPHHGNVTRGSDIGRGVAIHQ